MSQLLKKTETRVVLTVIVLLLVTEVLCRLFETRLSADVRHLRELPDVARRLAAAPDEAEKILIVGNSLAREGIDLPLLEEKLNGQDSRGTVTVAGFFPDGTSVSEWLWGYRRYFSAEQAIPDRVVIVTGRTHLQGGAINPERLGAFHIGDDDLVDALASMELEKRPRVLLARYSGLFTNRDRLRPLVGYRMLPGYESAMAKIVTIENQEALAAVDENARPAKPVEFERLLTTMSEQGVDTAVITVPLPEDYVLEESLVKLIEEKGARFFDLSALPGRNADDFPDGYHLGKRGQKLLTERLAAEVLSSALD